MPSAARLLLYSYVQRNPFEYCSLHVSTVISYVSQQFRFLHRHSQILCYKLPGG
ncbi:hypothetical protein T05_10092 [Trichinella murrelli]|uniref:Uncharacterized protein n=1 Tax=Trichinella murrelli TaxID=144512 RepID=A0A0V0UBI9_9BILA|nr:hypothetical protein T05_10092 [Trichinella murrelli]